MLEHSIKKNNKEQVLQEYIEIGNPQLVTKGAELGNELREIFRKNWGLDIKGFLVGWGTKCFKGLSRRIISYIYKTHLKKKKACAY